MLRGYSWNQAPHSGNEDTKRLSHPNKHHRAPVDPGCNVQRAQEDKNKKSTEASLRPKISQASRQRHPTNPLMSIGSPTPRPPLLYTDKYSEVCRLTRTHFWKTKFSCGGIYLGGVSLGGLTRRAVVIAMEVSVAESRFLYALTNLVVSISSCDRVFPGEGCMCFVLWV